MRELEPGRPGAAMAMAVAVMAGLGLACGVEGGRDAGAGDAAELRVLYPGRGALLSPLWDTSAQHLVFLPMFELDDNGEVQPRLVESWDSSESGLTWTYRLRDDIRWHDDVPMTAEDIVFSIDLRKELMTRMGVGSWPPPGTEATVVDEHTVSIHFPQSPTLREARPLWITYWPKHHLEGLDLEEFGSWEFWFEPVGNGPFRFVRRVPETLIELEANPRYDRGRPDLDRVILRLGGGSALTELWSGTVNAAMYVDRSETIELLQDPDYSVYWETFGWDVAAFWNHRHPVLSDVLVRRALIHALERTSFPEMLGLPPEMLPVDTIHPRQTELELPEPYSHDPDEARRLLTRAGWVDTDEDGVREKDGEELAVPAIIPAGGGFGSSIYEEMAILAQDAWRDIGLRLEIETLDAGALRRAVREGDYEGMVFDRFLQGRVFHLPNFGPDSVIGYDNPDVQELVRRAYEDVPPEEWPELFAELMPAFQADAPILFLMPQIITHVVDARFGGLSTPYRADPVGDAEHIRLAGETVIAQVLPSIEELPDGWSRLYPGGETSCAFGEEYFFLVRPGDPDRLMVRFSGGGGCRSYESCAGGGYVHSLVEESDGMPDRGPSEWPHDDHPENPVSEFTMVHVNFCTADAHLGERDFTYIRPEGFEREGAPATIRLRHRGSINARAVLDWVEANVVGPEVVFVIGGSAGGTGSPFWAGEIAGRYPEAAVYLLGMSAGSYRGARHDPRDPRGVVKMLRRHPGFEGLTTETHSAARLYVGTARAFPRVRMAMANTAHDAAQRRAIRDPAETVAERLDANVAQIREADADFVEFRAGGNEHGVDAYGYEADGVRFIDWVTDFVTGRPIRSRVCDDCTVPELYFTPEDLAVLERADEILATEARWRRAEAYDDECPDDVEGGRWTLSCTLFRAATEVTGRTPGYSDAGVAIEALVYGNGIGAGEGRAVPRLWRWEREPAADHAAVKGLLARTIERVRRALEEQSRESGGA